MTTAIKPGPRSKRGVGQNGNPRLARLVREKREALGMNQSEFAAAMGWKGRSTVSPIESGSRPLTSEDKIRRFSELTGVSPDDIYAIQGLIPHDIYEDISGFTPDQMQRLRAFIRSEL